MVRKKHLIYSNMLPKFTYKSTKSKVSKEAKQEMMSSCGGLKLEVGCKRHIYLSLERKYKMLMIAKVT